MECLPGPTFRPDIRSAEAEAAEAVEAASGRVVRPESAIRPGTSASVAAVALLRRPQVRPSTPLQEAQSLSFISPFHPFPVR